MNKNLKIRSICSNDAYDYLQSWIKRQHPNFPYTPKPEKYFYKNTQHREYLSKFIENVMMKLFRSVGADPIKAPDKGTYRDNTRIVTDVVGFKRKIGRAEYVRNKNVRRGRADIIVYYKGMLNLEVKVGKDRQSEEQKQEQARAEANGEQYIIIKTVDDVLDVIDIDWKNN